MRIRYALGFSAAIAGTIAMILSGCSSIVRKPEINKVKTVALVTLYADEMVPWTGGNGKINNFDTDTKNRVALQAYNAFTHEFTRLHWHPISLHQITANEFYKQAFATAPVTKDSGALAHVGNFLQQMHEAKYFAPKGLYAVEWPKPQQRKTASFSFKMEKHRDFMGDMAKLAKSLNVDAVVLVGLDYCYTGATAVLGNGTAKITAASWVRAITPDKDLVVKMPMLEGRCKGDRGESDKTVAMVGGSIALGKTFARDTLITAFTEASAASAKMNVDTIQKAIEK